MKRFCLVVFAVATLVCAMSCARDPIRPDPDDPGIPFRASVDTEPVWSPDGKWIAYRRRFPSADGPPGVYIISPAGGTPRFLTPGDFFFPRWFRFSPDGRYISCELGDQLMLIDVQTGATSHPFYSEYGVAEPEWSPDGRTIIYRRNYFVVGAPPESLGLHFFDLEAGRDRTFLSEGQVVTNGRSPLWSPDGTEIAATQGGFDHTWITAFRIDGTSSRRLVESPPGTGLGWILRRYIRKSVGLDAIGFEGATSLGTGFFAINWDGSGLARQPRHYIQSEEDWFSPDGSMCVGPRFDPTDSLVVLFVFKSDDVTGASARQLTRYEPPAGQPVPTLSSSFQYGIRRWSHVSPQYLRHPVLTDWWGGGGLGTRPQVVDGRTQHLGRDREGLHVARHVGRFGGVSAPGMAARVDGALDCK